MAMAVHHRRWLAWQAIRLYSKVGSLSRNLPEKSGSPTPQVRRIAPCLLLPSQPLAAHQKSDTKSLIRKQQWPCVGTGLVPRLASLETMRDVDRVPISREDDPIRKIVAVMRAGSLESPLIRQSLTHLRNTASNIWEVVSGKTGNFSCWWSTSGYSRYTTSTPGLSNPVLDHAPRNCSVKILNPATFTLCR